MAPKIDPGGLSEAAGAARSTQEQQRTTKKRPRATQERRKSGGKRFSRFSQPRILNPWGVGLQASGSGFGGGRLPKHGFRVEGVAIFCFSRGPRKNGSP